MIFGNSKINKIYLCVLGEVISIVCAYSLLKSALYEPNINIEGESNGIAVLILAFVAPCLIIVFGTALNLFFLFKIKTPKLLAKEILFRKNELNLNIFKFSCYSLIVALLLDLNRYSYFYIWNLIFYISLCILIIFLIIWIVYLNKQRN